MDYREKRKFVRIPIDFKIWYQTIYEEGDFTFGKEPSKNISAGGIQLEMEEVEHVGANLLMKIRIPDHEKEIIAKGKVVWTRRINSEKYDVGVEFYEILPEDMQTINNFAAA